MGASTLAAADSMQCNARVFIGSQPYLSTTLEVADLPGNRRAAIRADAGQVERLGEAADVLADLHHKLARGRHDQRNRPISLSKRRLQQHNIP